MNDQMINTALTDSEYHLVQNCIHESLLAMYDAYEKSGAGVYGDLVDRLTALREKLRDAKQRSDERWS